MPGELRHLTAWENHHIVVGVGGEGFSNLEMKLPGVELWSSVSGCRHQHYNDDTTVMMHQLYRT